MPGVLPEHRVVEEDVREGPGVPHAPHGRADHPQGPGDPLLCRGQETVLVCVDSEVTYVR